LFNEARTRMADLARYEQDSLNNESSWIGAVRGYKQSLDSFKLTLGLPIDTRVVLDNQELANLKIDHPEITSEEAIRVALVSRLDFYTTRDQFEDAERKIGIAANGLQADLDVILQANVPSKPGNGIPELDFRKTSVSGGLALDLPLDRKAERNSYRASLITYERARRALEQAVDDIKLDILNSWRQLDEAKRQYETSVLSVKIAEDRVREQILRDELGSANSEEVLAAQRDLTSQRNNLTTQLINHVISRLSLWRDMGVLAIKEDGSWEELNDVKRQ
jgi:outer membrane protein TolC